MTQLILKRASASRQSGEWNEDDFDVLANGAVVGRIFKANAAPVGASWMTAMAALLRRTGGGIPLTRPCCISACRGRPPLHDCGHNPVTAIAVPAPAVPP
jgi:hypothetical protein